MSKIDLFITIVKTRWSSRTSGTKIQNYILRLKNTWMSNHSIFSGWYSIFFYMLCYLQKLLALIVTSNFWQKTFLFQSTVLYVNFLMGLLFIKSRSRIQNSDINVFHSYTFVWTSEVNLTLKISNLKCFW